MKKLLVAFVIVLTGYGVTAQSKSRQHSTQITPGTVINLFADSSKNKTDTSAAEAKQSGHKTLSMSGDTLTPTDYVLSIERVNDNMNALRDSTTLGFEVVGMSRKVNRITDAVTLIRQNVRGRNTAVNIKNLYLYQSFAKNLDNENERIQTHITNIYDRVYGARQKLRTVLSDSVFRVLYANSKLRETYDKRLVRLEKKWSRTDSTAKASIDTLNAIKVKMADNCMNLSAIINMTDTRIDRAGKQLFGREVNFLWQKNKKITGPEAKAEASMASSEKKAIGYYFSQTSRQRSIVLVLGILLFIWLFNKRKIIRSLRSDDNPYGFLDLQYLKITPVFSLLIILMSLMPFFDAYAPTSYIAIEYTLLLIFSSFVIAAKEDFSFIFGWFLLVILFVADIITYLVIEPSLAGRIWMLSVHAAIIPCAVLFNKKIKKELPYSGWIKKAVIVGIILCGLAVISNLFGRFSLSGILGLAGIFAITQAVVLPVFVETVKEIILLQLQARRIKKGFDKPFDRTLIIDRVKTPLFLIALILWLIMITSNLNIYHAITDSLVSVMTTPVSIGNISIKLISVLFFFIIIWLAHILQKLISFLFGETGVETEDTTSVSKKQHSRLLIIRLIVLISGYLLAIAASGLPLDKITILLGALGVGIGMGLQNVVNNFVSGIILIFDGSLQIGDEIEVSGQSGKVKEIGLRASVLTTADGAEVIIPNGNMLSQNIVNWTFTNDEKRVVMWFILSGKELDSNVINDVINETISNIPGVITRKRPVILYTRVTPENCTVNVRFWSTINNAESVKSEAIQRLSPAFADKNIEFG